MRIIFTLLFLSIILLSSAIELEISGNSILISGDFKTPDFSIRNTDSEVFIKLNIDECTQSGKVGDPELPVYSKLINLPNQGNYILENISFDEQIIELDNLILPAGFIDENELNSIEYQKDEWLPTEIVTVSSPNIMSAYRFSQIAVSPLQYNPVMNKIRVLKNIEIELILDESDTKNPKLKQSNVNSFSKIAGSILNEESIVRTEQNGKYLFIIQDDTAPILDPLLRWKEKLGYKTRVATLSETGSSADDIKNFIQSAYDNWEIPPEYVVLVGDIDGSIAVPSFFVEGSYQPGTWDVSDHKYSLLEGDDYFPDVLVGRLSVRTQLELNTIISKIINYERNPMIEDNWQNKALMISLVDEWAEYYSMRETVMAVREKLLDFEYTAVDTFISPYQSGMSILANMISDGYSYINYRGFGGASYWWGNYGPLFDIYAIESLSNGFKLPMVTSIVCGGGDFANASYPSCFGEKWLTAGSPSDPKGAIGFIGPSEVDTKTPFNNANDMGIYQGITQEGITSCGEMMLRGKMELYNNYPNCHAWGNAYNSDQFYFYVYNLLGDPGLQVLTNTPKLFELIVEDEIASGSNYIEVEIELNEDDRSEFIIAITNPDSLITTGITNDQGFAYIPIELNAGTYEITASKYQFVPVISELLVIEQDIVMLDEYTCSEVIPGATISISANILNSGSQPANDLEFEISTDDEFITIVNGSSTLSTLAAGGFTNCEFEIELDNEWRDGIQSEIFLNILSDLGENTFIIPLNIISPQFSISDFIIDEPYGNLLQNAVSSFDLEFLNCGNYDAGETSIQLVPVSNNLEAIIGNSSCSEIVIGENELIQTSFEIEINNAISGELAKFNFIISDGENTLQEILYSYPIGVISEESPTFCDQGYMAIESSDVGNFTAPVYNWNEINPAYGGQGSTVEGGHVTGTDGFTKTIDLPFHFQYFGIIYDEISVCSNGWITMGDTDLMFFRNKNIPSGVGSKAMIAPFWDNLINSNVFSYYDDVENTFIIEWYNCRNYHSYSYETFQVIFYDPIHYPSINGNGDILFQYNLINNNDTYDNYATIGIENETQTDGLLITFANTYAPTAHVIENETAILFTANGDPQVNIDDNLISNEPKLFQNYPNPFNPTTTISFAMNDENFEDLELVIYNIKGQRIKQLEIRNVKLGMNEVVWNGVDEFGKSISSGVYFYKLVGDGKTIDTKKCLLLK